MTKVQGKDQGTTKLSDIRIKAVITRVETISEPLNWLSTLVAVEFEPFDIATEGSIAQLNFAQWTPMSEFAARYDRLAPAEIGMASAAKAFVTKLQNNLSTN